MFDITNGVDLSDFTEEQLAQYLKNTSGPICLAGEAKGIDLAELSKDIKDIND